MLGYVHGGQPTVILREFQRGEKVNAWICAQRAADRDPQSFNVNAWICTQRATDRDLESVFVKRKVNAWKCDRDLETKK